MKTLKTWMTAGLCAGALLSGAAALAQDAARSPAAFPAPGSPTIYKSAGDLDKVFQAELAKKNPTTQSRVQVTDRTSFNIVRRDQANTAVTHQGWDEIHYYLDGGGTIEAGGTTMHVKPGDIVFIPANSLHRYSALDGHVTYYEIRFPDAVGKSQGTTPPAAPAAGGPGLYFSGEKIAADLAKAFKANNTQGVVPVLVTDRFGINVLQRGAPGAAALHDGWNEMHYILAGQGTLTTGGTTTGSGATLAVQGGVAQTMTKGDVMIVPANTPHQYTAMSPSVTYLEVRFPNVVGESAAPPAR